MRIRIYRADIMSPFGLVCSAVTGAPYSHGSIINRGVEYDTTLLRGFFGRSDSRKSRWYLEVDLGESIDCQPWVRANIGRRYDLAGLLLWPFKKQSRGKLYCFEAVDEALKSVGVDLGMGKLKSGKLILEGLYSAGHSIRLGRTFTEAYDAKR